MPFPFSPMKHMTETLGIWLTKEKIILWLACAGGTVPVKEESPSLLTRVLRRMRSHVLNGALD